MKTAFLCFFPVMPTNMGSAEVIRSLFLCWPHQKRLFQISHLENPSKKNLTSFKIFSERPILKIVTLPLLVFKTLSYLRGERKKLVIIEGPSWIGYSFIALILIRIFSPSTKIIYHSHSIEYEVRKMMSNRLIALLSKKLEGFVFKYSNLSTSVSNLEIKKIKRLYNVKCVNLKNGISKKILKFKKKKIKLEYIIYCGSYKYLPNKIAINFIINKIMPKLTRAYPKIKLMITGGGLTINKDFLVNKGIVSKSKLFNLIYNSKLMVVPIDKGTGTRIKIIEALLVGAKILTTKKGIEGIIIQKGKFPIIAKKKNFSKKIIEILKKNTQKPKIENSYYKNYTMEKIVYNFLKNNHVENIFKKN